MGNGMADGFAGGGTQPQRAYLKVVAAAVAYPIAGMVEQHHHLVFVQVGLLLVNKSEPIDFQIIKLFAFFQQVLLVNPESLW